MRKPRHVPAEAARPPVAADSTPPWLQAVTLVCPPLVTFALYSQALSGAFIFDDGTAVVHNWAMLFRLWGTLLTSNRPLTNLSYVMNHSLGGTSPWGFHLVNILLHAANGVLVYVLVRLVLQQRRLGARYGDNHWAALAVSALFLLHPLQTEVAAYVASRGDVLSAFFVLGAMIGVALAHRWEGNQQWSTGARIAAAASVLCAVLSKESGAVAPLLLFLLDWAAAGGSAVVVLRRHWIFYGVLGAGWAVPASILLSHPEYALSSGFGFNRITPWQYLCTQPGVILHYLRLVVVPYGQVMDYDWPLATELITPGVLLPGAVVLVALIATVWSWRRWPLYSLCGLWFFINLAPTSSIVPIADLIAERRMYLPLLGVIGLLGLFTADTAQWLVREHRAPREAVLSTIGALVGVALIACTALTWQRNLLWQNPILMWRDSLAKAPGNPRIEANLGTIYAQQGQPGLALIHLERALQLIAEGRSVHATQRHAAMINTHLASVQFKLGDKQAALVAYQRAMADGAWKEQFLRKRLMSLQAALGVQAPAAK